jgi:hypothetical protein
MTTARIEREALTGIVQEFWRMGMKKLLFVWVAIAVGIVLVPRVYANAIIFDHNSATYTLTSYIPADQGSNVPVVNAFIQDNSGTESLAITGFEYYLGGSSVSGAAGDTPSQFLSALNSWTYELGAGAYGNGTGTAWNKNKSPIANGAVAPKDASKTDYLSAVTLENSRSSGFCYTGEILTPGSECEVELLVTPNCGGAEGTSSTTFLYGYAEGVEGKGTFNGTNWSKGSDAGVAQGMEESIEIDVAPEPNSLVLLGTGLGLLSFGLSLRKRFAGSEPSTIQSKIA